MATNDLIMIVRHGEKPITGADIGVEYDGQEDAGALTIQGWTRAGALAVVFGDDRFQLPAGLGRPDAIYAARPKQGGKGLRASETVTPLAARLGQRVDESHGTGEEAALAADLSNRTGTTLVVWEHTAIHDIFGALGQIEPAPPAAWSDDRFDMIWTLTRTPSGWSFAQVPQLILAGDSAIPIS